MHQPHTPQLPSQTNVTLSDLTASPAQIRSPNLTPLTPSQSLEDLHFNLAQEITRAMASSYTSHSPTSIKHPQLPTPPPHPTTATTTTTTTTTHTTPPRTPRQPYPQRKPKPAITKSPTPVRIHTRAPVMKPSPAEEELVRRIHRKVGGPSKLSTYDDPAKVRHVVIEALAQEQTNLSDAARIRKGQLSVFERRVVRTVTNRGAAVRSRMRQRKEVAQLKNELRIRDVRVRMLENIVRSLCLKFSAPLPEAVGGPVPVQTQADLKKGGEFNEGQSVESVVAPSVKVEGIDAPDFALDQELFGNLVDQMITMPPWS